MAGSELRQRKGKDVKEDKENTTPATNREVVEMFQQKCRDAMLDKAREENPNMSEEDIQNTADQAMKKMFEPKKPPLPGLKHETKAAKDALAEDPYNLELINNLGFAYIEEDKWTEAANVLIRGWKRMSEFDSPEKRFDYLYRLAGASFECGKYKQALAVLMDMEEPEDPEDLQNYCRLECKIYANNDNMQKTLKAFSKGLELHREFSSAQGYYLHCVQSLKKVGALDAARSALEKMATTDDDKQRLKLLEVVSELKTSIDSPGGVASNKRLQGFMAVALMGALGLLTYLLYLLEMRSLRSLNLAK